MSPFAHVIANDLAPVYLDSDDMFFARALDLGRRALGSTHPNPSVGAVVVKDGAIIGEGHTQPYGGMHAEIHALSKASRDTRGATLYVTLEPCSHFGKTPPCSDAVIKAGIKRVIYGVKDPNPRVFGQGEATLRNAHILVETCKNQMLTQEASALIAPFASWVLEKRPLVVLKIATSKDNKVAAHLFASRTKITGPESDLVVHRMRRAMDAIMVSGATVRIDNPRLTARLDSFGEKQPTRMVLSSSLDFDPGLAVFDGAAPSVVLTNEVHASKKARFLDNQNTTVIGCKMTDSHVDLNDAMQRLASLGYCSVLIEAGPTLFNAIISLGLAREVWWFRSPRILGEPGLDLGFNESHLANFGFMKEASHQLGGDTLTIFSK